MRHPVRAAEMWQLVCRTDPLYFCSHHCSPAIWLLPKLAWIVYWLPLGCRLLDGKKKTPVDLKTGSGSLCSSPWHIIHGLPLLAVVPSKTRREIRAGAGAAWRWCGGVVWWAKWQRHAARGSFCLSWLYTRALPMHRSSSSAAGKCVYPRVGLAYSTARKKPRLCFPMAPYGWALPGPPGPTVWPLYTLQPEGQGAGS